MTTNWHNPNSRECPAPTGNPAKQPQAPGDGKQCTCLPQTTAPELGPPAACPGPHPDCNCPGSPDATSNCLEDEIAKQSDCINAAEKAKLFRGELQKLLENAKKANLAYTRDKYVELLKEWTRQDLEIAELVRKLVCAVPCWRCILDCHVCPLLNELYYAEKSLFDNEQMYSHVHDLIDLQHWHTRDVEIKRRRFDRFASVMLSWGDPAKSISDALIANKAITDAAGKVIGAEPGKAIFEVFFRLIPLHLAIAPPATSETTTRIDESYTKFCECTEGQSDSCCGPDVGVRSFRQRLLAPQPYLINPDQFFKLICCMVEHRYVPAKVALSEAEAKLAAVGEKINNYKARISGDWAKVLEAAAKGAIPSVINCCDYKKQDDTAQKTSQAY